MVVYGKNEEQDIVINKITTLPIYSPQKLENNYLAFSKFQQKTE